MLKRHIFDDDDDSIIYYEVINHINFMDAIFVTITIVRLILIGMIVSIYHHF